MVSIMRIKIHTALALVLLPILVSSQSVVARTVSTCNKPKLTIPTTCAGLNTSASVEGNPFIYVNPEASCDLGLELPGLPSLGLDIGSLNFCEIAQSLTGDLVNELNQSMQNAVDGALEDVGLSQDMEFATDLQDMAMDALQGGRNNSSGGGSTPTNYYNEYGQDKRKRGTPECPSMYFDRRECGFD